MVEIVLDDGDHTFDASAKEITLVAPYTAMSEGQILKIVNLTSNTVIHDAATLPSLRHPISIAGAVITFTMNNTGMADTDLLQVIIDVGGSGTPIYVDVNNDAEVATTPAMYNVTMTLADTEYPRVLPANTKKVEFRCQDVGYETRFAYETGKVETPKQLNHF